MTQKYKIIVSYDGTDYCGWQRQPGEKTVQGQLEAALSKLTQKNTPVIGAGRTDAGVHASGQTAHFSAELRLENEELFRALNALLPNDIRVISCKKAPQDFHARKSARSKIYQYRIFNAPQISPFLIRYVLHWTLPLNVEKMKQAAALFVREADFSAFSSNRLLDPVRSVKHSEIKKKEDEIFYTIEANGFLRYMVRTIVGTLLETGKGKIQPEEIENIFKGKKRTLASPTAPPQGLCLMKVNY